MIIYALLAIFVLVTAGFIALSCAVKNAENGYEDASGFHRGIETPIESAIEVCIMERSPQATQKAQKRAKRGVPQGTIVARM
jgi:hypothetical protein